MVTGDDSKLDMKYIVSCMGSRERYGLPVALENSGRLHKFYTDIYMPHWLSKAARSYDFSPGVKALLQRNHPNLPFEKVSQSPLNAIRFRRKVRAAKTLSSKQLALLKYGELFAKSVARKIPKGASFVGFTGGCLESFKRVKELNGFCIMDQVDPGLFEWELVGKERKKFPGWELGGEQNWSVDFERRVREELDLADQVIVNSGHSQRAMEYWGVNKPISILPIASGISPHPRVSINVDRPLRVLFLGLLCLRKGVHHAITAVDRLVERGVEIELILAGESLIQEEMISKHRGLTYVGPVATSEIPALLDSSDVLLFPTLSDGFGMVQVEALSRGLPVVASQNCAEVVDSGKSGVVLEETSAESIAEVLKSYADDRALLSIHSKGAYIKSKEFSVSKYGQVVNEFFG